MKHPYRPKGCDDQGRYPEAAEAATDLGVQDPDEPEHDMMRVVIDDTLRAMAAVVVLCIIVLAAWWGY
jgi:hypothetical protein